MIWVYPSEMILDFGGLMDFVTYWVVTIDPQHKLHYSTRQNGLQRSLWFFLHYALSWVLSSLRGSNLSKILIYIHVMVLLLLLVKWFCYKILLSTFTESDGLTGKLTVGSSELKTAHLPVRRSVWFWYHCRKC